MNSTSSLVSVDWLNQHLDDKNLIVLDASLPKPKARAEDNPLHNVQIPGSRFFDIDNKFSDTSIDLPHMMPSADDFSKEARKLGVNNESTIVVYDNLGIYSSPRAWWMFKAIGHEQVYVLNGGLPEWVSNGNPIEERTVHEVPEGNFVGTSQAGFFKNSKEVLNYIDDEKTIILDARSKGRFEGSEPEPRAGLRGGHIPTSKSLPFPEVLDGNIIRTPDQLNEKFENMGVDEQQLVFSCGSGLTACIIALAADVAGKKELAIYDGSWSEWGQPGDLPVDIGA